MIPNEVNILGTTYTVSVTELDTDDAGRSNQVRRTIEVCSTLPSDSQVETFYHELLHMMMRHVGVNALLTSGQEEAFAQGLGMALNYVIQANPSLPGRK